MKELFELGWMGGAAERHFRKVRPGADDFPWGTLPVGDYPPLLVDRARVSWTEAAFNEYCTALAFCDLIAAMLEGQAPVDLIGMASDFIADEMHHVELTSRIAMDLGGGAPREVDFQSLRLPVAPGLSPRQRANEMVVALCCVGEAFSVPMLTGCLRSATHPLTRSVLERIVQDEVPHGRLGWLYLEWVADDLDPAERARLAEVAVSSLRSYEPLWKRVRSRVIDGVTSEGFLLSHIRELGWMEAQSYAAAAREAIQSDIIVPLRRFGIELPKTAIDSLLLEPDERAIVT